VNQASCTTLNRINWAPEGTNLDQPVRESSLLLPAEAGSRPWAARQGGPSSRKGNCWGAPEVARFDLIRGQPDNAWIHLLQAPTGGRNERPFMITTTMCLRFP